MFVADLRSLSRKPDWYDGNIWAEGQKGKGSTFFFTLPAGSTSIRSAEEIESEDDEETGTGQKTILLADDNRNMRKLLKYQLEKWGYRVLEAANGDQALKVTQRVRVDVITMDLMTPTMSGYDLLGMLRDDPMTRDIPIPVISVVEEKQKGILLGANEYLTKPFREEELIEKMRSVLGEEQHSILVVDDDPAVLDLLRVQLEEKGFTVDVAKNGDEAIRSLKKGVPDLVVLDVIMPGKNDYEVLCWIRNEPTVADLAVVILSAHPLEGEFEKLLYLGVEAHVTKSENLSALYEKIDSILKP